MWLQPKLPWHDYSFEYLMKLCTQYWHLCPCYRLNLTRHMPYICCTQIQMKHPGPLKLWILYS